jgi:hypothetical protein
MKRAAVAFFIAPLAAPAVAAILVDLRSLGSGMGADGDRDRGIGELSGHCRFGDARVFSLESARPNSRLDRRSSWVCHWRPDVAGFLRAVCIFEPSGFEGPR